MNRTIFLIGGLVGLSGVLKPSVKVFDNIPSLTLKQLKMYLLEMFAQGEITTETTLVFDVTSKKDNEVISFLKTILPEAKKLFSNNWHNFQKGIVLLLPEKSTLELNEILNQNGLSSFIRSTDVEDFLEVRGLIPFSKK